MANDPRLYRDENGNAPADRTSTDKPEVDGRRAMYWREIERYNRAVSDWHQEGDGIIDVYLAKGETQAGQSSKRKFSMLWANVEVLKPAVYAKCPNVVCERRHKDRDPVGRKAAELMERASNVSMEIYNVDETFRLVRDDRLLPGRGQAWVRYEAEIEQYEIEPDDNGIEDADTGAEPADPNEVPVAERIASEKVCVDYVHWKDFGHNVARTWSDVWLVWRVVYKTREECEERFGKEVAGKLTYNAKLPAYGSGAPTDDPDQRARIYELWDKKRKLTAWIADGYMQFLEIGPPPIKFETGFPCPEPCYGTKTSKEMIPRPDYSFYRDQAREINDLTEKIHNMSAYLVVKGFVPSAPSTVADPLDEMLRDKGNREMFLKVDSMADLTEKGGINELIQWFPVEKIQQAIQGAIQMRQQLIQDVYQITGISDVMRAQTNANETLGAQQMKMQTGTQRLRNTRDDIARFTRDISRLVCEVIADQFQPETIAQMTGYKYVPGPMMMPGGAQLFGPGQPLPMAANLPNPGPAIGSSMGPSPYPQTPMGAQMPNGNPIGMLAPRFGLPNLPAPQPGMQSDPNAMPGGPTDDMTFGDDVMQLLRNDRMRGFRVDIETDSTVLADQQQEKQSRMEFLGAVSPYMQQAVQGIQMAPALAPAFSEMLMFVVRGFHVGSGMEETIEKAFQMVAMQAMQAKQAPPQPDPTKMAEIQSRAQGEQQKLAAEGQRTMIEAQVATHAQQQDAQLEIRKQNLDFESKSRDRQHDAHATVLDRQAKLLAALQRPGKMQ